MELQLHNENDELFQIMKGKMSTEQEQIFMTSHYLYLQYGTDNTKFVIDFDDVWKNVEFTQKGSAKKILIKHFTEHIDYKIGASPKCEAPNGENIACSNCKASNDEKAACSNCKAPSISSKNIGGSGLNKETILLTVDCFKNFCMLASTPKAKVIRFYYVKMENIMHEYFRLKNNELQNTLTLSKNALQISIKETAIKRHEVLIESNKNKCVVYFCRIQLLEDGSFILKIGESTDVKSRMEALSCNFGTTVIILDIFSCENSLRFERFLHNSPEIIKYKYNNLEHKNKKMSTEAYHIPNQKEYEKIVKFAKTELSNYNSMEMMKLRVEEKRIDSNIKQNETDMEKYKVISSLIPFCKNYDEIMNILNKITSPINPTINHLEIEPKKEFVRIEEDPVLPIEPNNIQIEIIEEIVESQEEENSPEIKSEEEITISTIETTELFKTANATGPIVQIYHKYDLKKVVQVYNSIMETTRDFNYNNKTASSTAIKKAYQHKTLYLDYRWHFIFDRKENDLQKPRDIGETVITQERNQGQVAMLNIDKTKILKVFKLAKDAAKEILQHPSAMCVAIKHSTPLNNHYWFRWENIDEHIQEEFLQSNILPIKAKNVRGIRIKQLHPTTNEIVKIFASYTDIQKDLKISVKKIKELIENNEIYLGKYKFKLF